MPRLIAVVLGILAVATVPAFAAGMSTPETQIFGKDPGKGRAFACFVRHYDATHLKAHPKQNVTDMGGPDKVRIALVANGPALTAFTSKDINPDVERRLRKVADLGLDLGACGNTLDATRLTVADLVAGFTRIDEGGVVRLAKLQAEGWAYIRP